MIIVVVSLYILIGLKCFNQGKNRRRGTRAAIAIFWPLRYINKIASKIATEAYRG